MKFEGKSWNCFYYCEFTFNCNLSFLNYCKFTLNCNFIFLAFSFCFLILSCAFEHFIIYYIIKCIINDLLLLLLLLLLTPFQTTSEGTLTTVCQVYMFSLNADCAERKALLGVIRYIILGYTRYLWKKLTGLGIFKIEIQ